MFKKGPECVERLYEEDIHEDKEVSQQREGIFKVEYLLCILKVYVGRYVSIGLSSKFSWRAVYNRLPLYTRSVGKYS